MSTTNIHSLLSSPWYVHPQYMQTLKPMLSNLLSKNQLPKASEQKDFVRVLNIDDSEENINDTSNSTSSPGAVAIYEIKHGIYKYDQACGPVGTQTIMDRLDSMKGNSNIKGIVLDIDSGGGQAVNTPEMHEYLLEYPKPVVTFSDGMLASAAYYIAAGTDYIIAQKRAHAIGSIGTMTVYVDYTGYYEKNGFVVDEIYATKSILKNFISRQEDREKRVALIVQKHLDPFNEEFLQHIKSSRNLTDEAALSGEDFNAEEALEKGLIDQIGTLQDAIEKVVELSQVNNQNSNTTMQTSDLPLVHAALGLQTALGANDKGTYLNAQQLQDLEANMASSAKALQDAEAAHKIALDAKATEIDGLQQTNTDLEAKQTATTTFLAEIAQSIGLEKDADNEAIQARIAEMNGQPGTTHTGTGEDPDAQQNADYNFKSSIYQTK